MLSDRESSRKSLICPLYGGGSGNTLTATQQPRTPKQRAIFLNVEIMTQEEKTELATAMEGCERRAMDLLLFALQLAELLESPKETPRADGGRPLKRVNAIWEDAAELIAEVQKSAKYCADDMLHLISEVSFYIDQPTTPPHPNGVTHRRSHRNSPNFAFVASGYIIPPLNRQRATRSKLAHNFPTFREYPEQRLIAEVNRPGYCFDMNKTYRRK